MTNVQCRISSLFHVPSFICIVDICSWHIEAYTLWPVRWYNACLKECIPQNTAAFDQLYTPHNKLCSPWAVNFEFLGLVLVEHSLHFRKYLQDKLHRSASVEMIIKTILANTRVAWIIIIWHMMKRNTYAPHPYKNLDSPTKTASRQWLGWWFLKINHLRNAVDHTIFMTLMHTIVHQLWLNKS